MGVGTAHGRVRALDGVRGLAVAAVLCFHAEFGFASGGFLGVSAFFTLSGFLITSLLLTEHQATGRIALGAFWARRARRLLPAAAVALFGVLVYGATIATTDQLGDLRGDILSAVGYVANWRFEASGNEYSELFEAPSPVLHFWSLAIEEQFYALFPLFVVGAIALGRGRTRALTWMLAAGIAASVLATVLARDTSRVYYGTDTRASELLVGALLACVLFHRSLPTSKAARSIVGTAGALALAVLTCWWVTVDQGDEWLYRGGFAVHGALVAVVLVAALSGTRVARALGASPLVGLGCISYGVYLYHWPIFLWLSPERTGLAAASLFALRVACTLACAIASYYFVEQPIRTGRRIRGSWPRLVAPAATGALVVALIAVTASPPAPAFRLEAVQAHAPVAADARVALVPIAETPTPAPATAPAAVVLAPFHRPLDAPRQLRVMVVGDSVGLSLGRGLELWGEETGRAVVRNEGMLWCALGRDLPRIAGYGPDEQGAGCNEWDRRWTRAIDRFDPDVVVVLFTLWEMSLRQLPGTEEFVGPGNPGLDAWQLGEYQAAADVLSQRGAAVAWLSVPCAQTDTSTPGTAIALVNRTVTELDRSRRAVRALDLDGALCPDGEFVRAFGGVDPARPDGWHFSDDGAIAVARWIMPQVFGEVPIPELAEPPHRAR
ncbi:MAG: acyltransferase family protein [Actinomycetota bacterium]